MFDEFNPCRKKRSVATRHGDDSFDTRSKCFVSGGGGGSGGGSTQSSATSYNTNIPEYAQPYVTSMLNATTQQLFNVNPQGQITGFSPYKAYGGTYDANGNMTSYNPAAGIAGFSPLQQQVQENVANLETPTQFGVGSDYASAAGAGALSTTGQATGYGSMGAGYGAQGANIGQGALGYGQAGAAIGQQAVGAAQQGFGAGQAYQNMATSPTAMQAYMNPYVNASLAPQLQLMNQQLAQTQMKNQAQAVGQGAYGGSRQAVQQGLDQQNADLAKQQLIAQGYNEAFKSAQQAQQFGANLGIQGLGAGTQALQTGIQGQQAGLAGVQGALAGTAQGMQGAQIGLQGVQGAQAGYGLANQAAGTLGQLGTAQLAAQQGILNQQNSVGAQQQAYQQQILNQAMQDYANAQQYPLMQLGTMSNMLRGLPLQSSTTQQYIAQPNQTTQAIGAAGSLGSLYQAAGRKEGGILKAKKMAKGGITSYDIGGAVEADLYDMPIERLQKELQSPSGEIRKKAKRIMAEKSIEGKAGGGIIAFAGGTPDPEIIPAEPAPQQTATDVQYNAQQPTAPTTPQAAPAPAPQAAPAPRRGIASDPRGMATQLAQQAIAAGDRSIEDVYAELQKGRAPDTARTDYRSKIMEERANARDEDSRQNWMRAAQFFASWGSMPGNTLAAGMQALKGILPDVMSDRKEQKKYQREIDKTLYTLDEAVRLEQNGLWDKAAELKQKLGEEKYKVLGPLSTMYSADVHAAATRAASAASSGRETDMKFLYNKKLSELTDGNPGKATAAQEAEAAKWASNQSKGLPEQKLDYKKIEAANRLISDSEKNGAISQLEKARRMALVQAAPDQKAAINQEYDDKVMAAKNEILNRAEAPAAVAPNASPAPQAAAPTAMALPSSQDQLKAGQVYNTSKGPAKWDGNQFVAS
jgi:hypothetical protein